MAKCSNIHLIALLKLQIMIILIINESADIFSIDKTVNFFFHKFPTINKLNYW